MPLNDRPLTGVPVRGARSERPANRELLPEHFRLIVEAIDDTGSMHDHSPQNHDFAGAVVSGVGELNPRLLNLVYVLPAVLSGPPVFGDIVKLKNFKALPDYKPLGNSPYSKLFAGTLERLVKFWKESVVPSDVTCKSLLVAIFGDLKTDKDDTDAAVEEARKLAGWVKEFGGEIKVIGPDPAVMNFAFLEPLGVKEDAVKYLSDDPKAIVRWTVETLSERRD